MCPTGASYVSCIIGKINEHILNPFIELLFAVALVVFLWGVVQFIWNADSDEKRKEGAKHMLYGVIGLFIMVSVVGILRIIINTFGLPTPPGLPFFY